MSSAAVVAPSHIEIKRSIPNFATGRRPVMAMILIGVSVLATFSWVLAMIWLASVLFSAL